MKTSILMLTVCLSFFCTVAGCADQTTGGNPPTPGIYYKVVPTELTVNVEQGLGRVLKENPLSTERRDAVRSAVRAMARDTSRSAEQWKAVKDAGDAAIPVVVDMLTSQDDSLRLRAAVSLTAFERPGNPTPAYLTKTEPLLVLICRRALLDRNYDVRKEAFGLLYRLGVRRRQADLGPIMAAFEDALKDPDARIRKRALKAIDVFRESRNEYPLRGVP